MVKIYGKGMRNLMLAAGLGFSLLAHANISELSPGTRNSGAFPGKPNFGYGLNGLRPTGGDADYREDEEATHFPGMVLVSDMDMAEAIAMLEEQGVTVLYHRGDMILAYFPVGWNPSEDSTDAEEDDSSATRRNSAPKYAAVGGAATPSLPGMRVEFSRVRSNRPTMYQARDFYNAAAINEGAGLPQPFTGKGVVVGVCDIGMDTHHPNFLNADGTECRIRRVVHYREQQGERTVYSTPEEIYEWRTDTDEDYHGTHTTGIAAGAHPTSGNDGSEYNYRSLAPDADIVFTCSQLSDVGLLAGVEDIIAFAKEAGKPAVINLSMGNNLGPHDGTSLFSRYLDLCAEDAIICISAGNDGGGGNYAISNTFDFTEGQTEYRILPADWAAIDTDAMGEIWSTDDTPFTFALYLSNNTRYADKIDAFPDIDVPTDGTTAEWRVSSDEDDPDYDETFAAHYNPGCFFHAIGGVSPLNGRFYVEFEYSIETDERHGNNGWAEYWPAVKLIGQPGQHVDMHVAGAGVRWAGEKTFRGADNGLSISDLATGRKVISVGMMNNTDIWDDAPAGEGVMKGEVTVYSSYGTLADGRKLPMTVAPGAYMYSSISTPFIEANPDFLPAVDDISVVDGQTYYWMGDLGTSMSCPFVVSAIANWLQGYPQLSSEQAIEIVKATNRTDYPMPDDPRNGQGWFDALNGIRKVLDLAVTKVGTADAQGVTLRADRGRLLIANPTGEALTVEIYTAGGVLVERGRFEALTGEYTLGHLPRGLYIVHLPSQPGFGGTKIIL